MLNILYSQFSPDTITQSILRISEATQKITLLCLEEGIQQGKWSLDDAGRFTLTLPETMSGALAKRNYLINRAFIYDESLQVTGDFPLEVLQLETECIFRQFIDVVQRSSARIGLYGLCGDYLPLYLQWQNIQTLGIEIGTPRYDYAFGSVPPTIEGFANTIYTAPFDLRSWQPNSPPERHWDTFVVERPTGIPVVATIINNSVLFSETLDRNTEQFLHSASQSISQLFGTIFGEILFFIDESNVTFAAFSHVTSNTIDELSMDGVMEKELISLREV